MSLEPRAKRTGFIGDQKDAIKRVVSYVERAVGYLGRPPSTVVVFAEDYDALDLRRFRHQPHKIVRGPSVQEYL